MLNMGFHDQLDTISNQVRPDRQALLFSATFPGKLREACGKWVENAVTIRCSTFELTSALASGVADAHMASSSGATELATETTTMMTTASSSGDGLNTSANPIREKGSAHGTGSNSLLTISHTVSQQVHLCAAHKKPRLLIKHLERIRAQEKAANTRQPCSVLIFCTKIKTLSFVVSFLRKQELKVALPPCHSLSLDPPRTNHSIRSSVYTAS